MADVQPVDLATVEAGSNTPAAEVEGVLDSIQIQVENGSIVEIGPPKGSTAFVMANIFADDDKLNQLSMAYAKACMFVRSIDGTPWMRPTNKVMLQETANRLGDDGLDSVLAAIQEYWPPVTSASLKVLKKNLR